MGVSQLQLRVSRNTVQLSLRFWILDVVLPHFPGKIFRAILVDFSRCSFIFGSFSQPSVNFSQSQAILVKFSQL